MASFIPDHSKKPKEASITLSSYRNANAEPRDNAPISRAMEGLAVHDEVNDEEHAKKDEKKKGSKSKSPVPKKAKEKEKAKEKKEAKVETPKSPPKDKGKKAEKEPNVQNGCAPAILVSQVMELGMKPLFENYLSPVLLQYKKSDTFRRGAQHWNLLCVTKTPPDYVFRAEDFARFTAEDLYQNFLSKRTDAGRIFQEYLDDEEWMWDCMVNFETMKMETTTFEEFMHRFDDILRMFEYTNFAEENSENIQTLKKLYDKYWDHKKKRPKKV